MAELWQPRQEEEEEEEEAHANCRELGGESPIGGDKHRAIVEDTL